MLAFSIRFLYLQDNFVENSNGETFATTLVDDYQLEASRMVEENYLLFPPQPIDRSDARMILHPPGYAILLRVLYGASVPDKTYRLLKFLHMVCDSLSAVIIFLIAAELLPLTLAAIGALLVALSPHLAYYTQWLTPDSMAVLPILLAIYFIIKAIQKPRLLNFIIAGALLGMSCWLRANGLLLVPFLALFLIRFFESRKRWQYVSAFISTMCLVIAPITIRNWVSYKHFIPLSLGSGITLIEGIGEYDSENQFGLPADDLETGLKEAEWYGNPEYAEQLWKLEGLKRDRARFAKGVAVIKSNPGWFLSVVLRRMAFMLRYNDFRQQNRTFNHTIAPTVLPVPNFNHPVITGENAQPVWSMAAVEALPELSSSSETSLQNEANVLHIQGSVSARGELLSFPFIPVKKQTDYILKIQNRVGQGDAEFEVKTADPRITLAQLNVGVEATRKKKKKQNQENSEPPEVTPPSLNFKQLAFTSAATDEVNLVVSKRGKESEEMTMQIDRVELFEMGSTPYQWTRFPRSIIRGIQKNVYKTDLLRLLIIVGILFLAFIKQYRTLLILLAVPIYYLCIQGILHTEYRYILVIHYFFL